MVVAELNILLERFRIAEGSLYPGMAQEPLDLFQRHPALKGKGRGSMTENMRRNVYSNFTSEHNLLDFVLNGLDGEPVMRGTASNKESGRIVVPGSKVCAEGYFSFGIQECRAAFSAFASFDVDCMISKINVRDIKGTEFRNTAGGGIKEIHHCLLAERLTYTANGFQLQGRHRETFRTVNADRGDAADDVLPDNIFLAAPFKETV